MRAIALVLALAPALGQTDCAERVRHTVAIAEREILGSLQDGQRRELTLLLSNLCYASAAERGTRRAHTTQGLKREKMNSREQPPIGVIVDIERDDPGETRD